MDESILIGSALGTLLRRVPSKMEEDVVESDLIREVALEIRRPADGSARREEQMMRFAEIKDGAHVERRVATPVDHRGRLVVLQ